MIEDECGAPDFFSGMRMVAVEGPDGKMLPENLIERIARYPQDAVHHGRAAAITMTQATEAGTVYTLDEIDAISKIAKENGLPLHMDGARFANALAALGTTPAEMTWKRGVDVLSFGGTKNGCWCAEAIVFSILRLPGTSPSCASVPPSFFEIAFHRRAIRSLPAGRPVARSRRPRQCHGQPAARRFRLTEQRPPGMADTGQRGFRHSAQGSR